MDLYPTLCELAKVPIPASLEGTSFAPLLSDADLHWKTSAFSQFHRYPRVTPDGKDYMGLSMVTSRYHYVEWHLWNDIDKSVGPMAAVELYDLQDDPNEDTNIAELETNKMLLEDLSKQLHRGWRFAVPPR